MGANSNTESVWFLIVICIVAALATHVFTSHPPGEEDSPLPTGGYPLMETLDMLYGHESLFGLVLEGDGGSAQGPYHIHREFWQDGCEFWEVDWDYDDNVMEKDKCELVILGVWLRYCPNAVVTGDVELLLRYFHTPSAPYREDTNRYIERVLKESSGE